MTNKKAIRVLEHIEYYLKTHTNESCEEEHTAINLAIEALKSPQDELIRLDSAKRVIAKFKGYLDEDMILRIQIALEKEYEAEMKGGVEE